MGEAVKFRRLRTAAGESRLIDEVNDSNNGRQQKAVQSESSPLYTKCRFPIAWSTCRQWSRKGSDRRFSSTACRASTARAPHWIGLALLGPAPNTHRRLPWPSSRGQSWCLANWPSCVSVRGVGSIVHRGGLLAGSDRSCVDGSYSPSPAPAQG